MTAKALFEKAQESLTAQRPFVLYRKPQKQYSSTQRLCAFFQQDAQLHCVQNFTEAGFVMAPFDLEQQPAIIFPLAHSQQEEAKFTAQHTTSTPQPAFIADNQNLAHQFHLDLVKKGVASIKAGELQKVVLSRCVSHPLHSSITTLYQRLLNQYPTAFVYCWFHPEIGLWMGATPETLLQLNGKTLKTMALAGTKSALETPEPQWTEKEIKEQQFVTDYIADTIKEIVSDLHISPAQNAKAGKVWHLKSDLRARLKQQKDVERLIRQLHPTPAVAGTPKDKAIAFIKAHEGYDREFYSGFLGELNLKTQHIRRANRRSIEQQSYTHPMACTELFVNLRCMKIETDYCKLFVGGGIVTDSQPESEWQETINKSRTMADVLR